MTRILVVEEDDAGAHSLIGVLEADGYDVARARSGPEALQAVGTVHPDLIILDVLLPGHDGFRVLRTIRDAGDETPAVVLTARRAQEDKVRAFRLGADDYVTKPFHAPELLARVSALLRRTRRCGAPPAAGRNLLLPPTTALGPLGAAPRATPHAEADAGPTPTDGAPPRRTCFGDVEVDRAAHVVRRQGTPVALTPKEYQLLVTLMDRRTVATRAELLRDVWGAHGATVTPRTVDMHVAELRRKLERVPSIPQHLVTVRKVGYRFQA